MRLQACEVINRFDPANYDWQHCRPGMDGAACPDPAAVLTYCGQELDTFRLQQASDGVAVYEPLADPDDNGMDGVEAVIFFIHGGRLPVAEMKAQQRKARLKIHDTHPDDWLYKTACGRNRDDVLIWENDPGDVTCEACKRMDFTDHEHLAMLRQ